MLVRAARQRAQRAQRNRVSCQQLPLSCLHQTYSRTILDRRRFLSIGIRARGPGTGKRRNSNDPSSLSPRRALATAISHRELDDIPFEKMNSIAPPPPPRIGDGYSDFKGWPNLEPFSPSTFLDLGGSAILPPQRLRLAKETGIGGDVRDVASVFRACLQVGRIERAGTILRRIIRGTDLTTDVQAELHNQYLRGSVEQIMLNPSNSATNELHKWFELEIRTKNIPLNIEMLAYMVKASLQSQGNQQERLVRRYMDMLDEEGVLQLFGADILTPREINMITHIYPKYNFASELLADDPELDDMSIEQSQQTGSSGEAPSLDVKPTEQKGLGLRSLKKSLSLFSELPREGIDISQASPEFKRELQQRLEDDAIQSAIDRWREESSHLTNMGLDTSLQTKSLGARMWKWLTALEEYLKEEVAKVNQSELAENKTSEDRDRCQYGPFLQILSPDRLAAVTILACMTSLSTRGIEKGMTLSTAIMSIAHSVEDESVFELMQRDRKRTIWPSAKAKMFGRGQAAAKLMKKATRSRGPGSVAKYMSRFLIDDQLETSALAQWPAAVKARVGAFLMSALIEVAKFPVTSIHPETKEEISQLQPAFSHGVHYRLGRKIGIITANKALVGLLKREPVHSILAKHLPMLVKPEPWTDFSKGGYLSQSSKIMRIKHGDKDQRCYAEAAIGQGSMDQIFKGLDVLGKTPWRINQEVFDVMLEAWNSGEAIASIPPETPQLAVPPEPKLSQDPLERRRWIREVKLVENNRSALHSQRCFQNFQMEIARALRNEEFYFPHNVDFRGRAYPIPPYLNHMGADNCRGLLRFGHGKELGQNGLRWLKIHLANVFGFDKASLSEREAFAMQHMEDIYDSAEKPLAGSRWWLAAEDPWQCLAACMELRNALESSDPTRFVSHLPIHQDGTCNGLQHYAALGGDSWGAKQVNLEPGDRPADVYTAVADLVKESIAKDKENGVAAALILDGKITRKVVKQTVMTNVYGVTLVGAKAQVRRQLIAANKDIPMTGKLDAGALSTYVVRKIFKALSTMFRGAHDIQYWFAECASRISTCLTPEQLMRLEAEWPRLSSKGNTKPRRGPVPVSRHTPPTLEELIHFKSSVIWTTPLHMPVVQPYRTCKSKHIITPLQRLNLSEPHRSDPVSKRKQLQAFPPNFIHSLDATHMLLSALRCDELGIAFAAVHDSFWTHASDIDTMNTVLRDCFIRIHSEHVVGRLAAEFSARYKGCVYVAKIRPTSPAYQKIAAWREARWKDKRLTKSQKTPKVKTLPPLQELILERERERLLNSSDPDEVVRGKNMVTPASIFAEFATDDDVVEDEEFQDLGLGDMSSEASQRKSEVESAMGSPLNVDNANGSLPEDVGSDGLLTADAQSDEDLDHSLDAEKESNDEDISDKPGHDFVEVKQFDGFITAPSKPYRKGPVKNLEIWLPLTFPPVPKKGEFDVSRLRDSKYFFS